MRKITLEIYYLSMCCSNSFCGPHVDPGLERFSSDLERLKTQNVEVIWHDLSYIPAAFVTHESVRNALEEQGKECLPLILVDGYIVCKGTYPCKDELITFLEIPANEKFGNKISDYGAQCCNGSGQCC